MFVKMKDALIIVHYYSSKCCNNVLQEFGGNTYRKNIKQLVKLLAILTFSFCVCIKWLILPKKHMKIMAQNIKKIVKPRVGRKKIQ